MRSRIYIFAAVAALLFMTACSTGGDKEQVAVQSPDQIVIPGAEYTQSAAMASHLSNKNVQIYNLDSGAGAAAGKAPAFQSFPARDPSVMIYPLDGEVPPGPLGSNATTPARVVSESVPPMGGGSSAGRLPVRPGVDGAPLTTVYFGHNSSSVKAEDKPALRTLAQQHADGSPLKVEGHASTRAATSDPVQQRMINLKASMERALSVSRELIRDGVPAEAIETKAWGDTRPPADDAGQPSLEAASRRVEIFGTGR